jgi:FtsH-binding integral membrane protein
MKKIGSHMQEINLQTAPTTHTIKVQNKKNFLLKTYAHLFAGLGLFTLFNIGIFSTTLFILLTQILLNSSWVYFVIVVSFTLIHSILINFMMNTNSKLKQYLLLVLYIAIEAIVCYPIVLIGLFFGIIFQATIITFVIFAILTLVVLVSKHDFSFLKTYLSVGILTALGLIIFSLIFGFQLGILFTTAMIFLACGYILYDTSKLLYLYTDDQYIPAASSLLSSLLLLFFYIIRLLRQIKN